MTDIEFEKLFREQFGMLTNLAASVVRDGDIAKDIVQMVFLKLWQKKEELTIRGPVIPYLCKAVVNTAFNEIAKNKQTICLDNFPDIHKIAGNESESLLKEERNEKVRQALEELPPVCRKVFSMSRFTDLTNKDIAREMNISVKAVEKHISKAYKILRVQLKPLISSENAILAFIISLKNFISGVGFLICLLSICNYILC